MRYFSLLSIMLSVISVFPVPACATILLFDQERDAATQSIVGPTTDGGTLSSDYGDNVTDSSMAVPGGVFTYGQEDEGFTPEIAVNIYSAAATLTDARVKLWQSGYGDLVNVIFADGPNTAGSSQLNVLFTANPGYVVDLFGFELAGFGADFIISGVSVLAGTSTLYSDINVLVQGNSSGPRHTTFAFNTPFSASELLLQVDLSNLPAAIQDNVGMDSIRFGQRTILVVPEPAIALFLLVWLGIKAIMPHRCNR